MTDQPQHPLIAAERVRGAAVLDPEGDKLGHIEEVVIDKVSGKVAYALMAFGGVLGIGERRHPVPWSLLKYDVGKSGYVVPLTEASLKDAPSFESHELSGDDSGYRDRVFGFYEQYGAYPYWI